MASPSEEVGGAGAGDEVRFGAGSPLRHPRQFAETGVRSLRASVPLARRLFLRDMRARYRLSALGFAWILLPPLAQTAVWLFLNESQILNSGETQLPLALYVLVGTLLFQGFTDALFAPGNQVASSSALLSRVSFPPESLLLAAAADATVNTLIRLTIAIPVLVYYRVEPGWGLALAPMGLAVILALGFGVGLILAPFGLLYHDVGRAMTIATAFLLLVTPVAYVAPTRGIGRHLSRFNPVSQPLVATREWLTGGPIDQGWLLWAIGAGALGLLVVGWALFRVALPHLVDRVGA